MHIKEHNEVLPMFEYFAEVVPEPIYWLDLEQRIIGFSSIAIKGIGAKSHEDVEGKNPLDLYPKEMAEYIIANHKEVIRTGQKVRREESIEDVTTGQLKIFDATIAPLYDEQKNIIGTCGISIDITERKQLQEETLKQKIALENKDQLKKEFIKNFSHDVRLPINGIVGNTQLLQILAKDNAALKQSAIKVDNGVMSLTKMFDHLYGVMMNDELNNEIHNKDFNFTDMVDLEIALTKSSIPPNQNVKVDVSLDDKIPQNLHGDNFKVSQILRNILSNSVKYTEKGTIKLIAKVLEDTKDTIKIKFTIADTGSGITPTDKNKVYEYGRRFVTSYETNIPGTGIGLSIAKKHVDRLGGSIDFDSEPGQGTEFFVELTFKKVQETLPQ